MRVLLICPQYADVILPDTAPDSFYNASVSVANFRRPSAVTIVPIGLAYIAAVLEKRHVVKMIYQDISASALREFRPDIVGISCVLSLQESVTFELAEFVKQHVPNAKVVVGGTHPTALPERMLANDYIDFVILGEGEYSMLSLADRLDRGDSIKSLDGFAGKANGTIEINPKTFLIEDLDELPIPLLTFDETVPKCLSLVHTMWNRRTLLGFMLNEGRRSDTHAERRDLFSRRRKALNIPEAFARTKGDLDWINRRIQCLVTSRGCPFRCDYCTSKMMWKQRYRTRSVENLLAEVEQFPHREIIICDENMTLDRARATEFFEAVEPLNKQFFFYNGVDLYTLDDELIGKMKKGGVTKISISIESGSADTARKIHRRLDFEKVKHVLSALARNNILTAVYFITGFPEETDTDVRETLGAMEYCMVNFPIIVHMYKLLYLPGSRLYEIHRDSLNDNFDEYCFFPIESYDCLQIKDSIALVPAEIGRLIDHQGYAFRGHDRG